MERSVEKVKERLWRRRLAKFARSGQTVAKFCLAEKVSAPTFYQWKRRLASESVGIVGGKPGSAGTTDRVTRFLPVRIENSTMVEIGLPNGTRVRVPSSDLRALEAAIAAAGRIPVGCEAEASRC